jgi:protease I
MGVGNDRAGRFTTMRLKRARAIVLVEDQYEDLEAWYPILRLREEGAEVVTVGPRKDRTYTSKHGYPLRSDAAADETDARKFDALIIPGGYAPDLMRRNPDMVHLVSQAYDNDRIVGAICHAGWMLASAEILKGRKVAGSFAIKDDLVHAGATFVDQEVVVDGNLITSRNPNDLPAFMRAIIEKMSGMH